MAINVRLASVQTLTRKALAGREGRHWYRFASAQVKAAAELLGEDRKRFADILSLLSPRVSVRRNIRFALHYCRTGRFAHDVMRGIRASVRHYELTGEIRGPKTSAFARAIRGDGKAIVLDVWMARAFGCDQKHFSVKRVHTECCKRIRKAARELGWTPAETQAAIWCHEVKRAGRQPAYFHIVEQTLFGLEIVE